MPKLTKLTENDFRKPGSLTREKVLATIDDAIEVAQGLGEKYIWVDCLCIKQDDDADKQEFISQMDSIYGCASVTIVAASGDYADAGLPGIKPNSRTGEQKPFTIKGVSIMRALDPERSAEGLPQENNYVEDSVWSSRGWTLQEKIFSRRALKFTEEQVYWECQQATWCEDGLWETKQTPTVYRSCLPNDFRLPWPSDLSSFKRIFRKLAVEYSRRTLTYGSDGLDAFEGILNAWRRNGRQDFLWALPISLLSRMLTWHCDELFSKRREEMCPVRFSDRTTECPFPSWSWVGWVGVVKTFGMDASESVILYYLDGKLELHRVVPADGRQMKSVWVEGCIVQGLCWGTGRTDVTLEEIRPASVLSQSIASNILFFWSSTAKLHFRHPDRTDFEYYNLILSHNDKDVESRWDQTPVLEPGQKKMAEFVVIGRSHGSDFVVLLVDWKDGVAYRQGLPTIPVSAWVELDNREWKLICLG